MSINLARVAVIGGGPSGCTVAHLLSKLGNDVTIFSPSERPELVIGESLVPAIIPILKRLGLEERISRFSVKKMGASLFLEDPLDWSLSFSRNEESGEHYAYHVLRDKFDNLFQELAKNSSLNFVPEKAEVFVQEDKSVQIANHKPFTFVIDASGRSRVLSRVLRLPFKVGKRSDLALFTHYSHAELPHDSHIHLGVPFWKNDQDEGVWTWRIPLPGRVSVGVVGPAKFLQSFGETDRERCENYLRQHALSGSTLSPDFQALTDTFRYTNYQRISQQLTGPNWALVGDAAGFVDPVFSGGAYLSLWSAELLVESLMKDNITDYQSHYFAHLEAWMKLVDSFYDGRFFQMVRVGNYLERSGREFSSARKTVSQVVSGIGTTNQETMEQYFSLLETCSAMPGSFK